MDSPWIRSPGSEADLYAGSHVNTYLDLARNFLNPLSLSQSLSIISDAYRPACIEEEWTDSGIACTPAGRYHYALAGSQVVDAVPQSGGPIR